MTASIIAHPRWVQRAGGIAEVDRHFQLRGFDTVFVDGSQYLHVEPKPAATPVTARPYRPRMHHFWPHT